MGIPLSQVFLCMDFIYCSVLMYARSSGLPFLTRGQHLGGTAFFHAVLHAPYYALLVLAPPFQFVVFASFISVLVAMKDWVLHVIKRNKQLPVRLPSSHNTSPK